MIVPGQRACRRLSNPMEIFEWNLRSGSGDRCLSGGGSGPQDLIDGNLSGGIGFKSEKGRELCHRFPQKDMLIAIKNTILACLLLPQIWAQIWAVGKAQEDRHAPHG